MGSLGEAALEDGAEESGGLLPGCEEFALLPLSRGFAVVDCCRDGSGEGFAKAGIVDDIADGAGVGDDGACLCHD